jgi:phosphate-selective porin O/P
MRRWSALAALMLVPATALAGFKVYEKDDQSLEVGMRLQPRMEYSRIPAVTGGTEWMRDFMIRRARFKLNGKIQGVSFGFEWKIDGTDQNLTAATSSSNPPFAQVENAWFQYPLNGAVSLRAGLYDAPFSRDLLTSDSKQLAVDRGVVSAVPSAFGLVDNVVGFDLRGNMKGGHAQYAVGLFDNRTLATRRQDAPMVVGRLDLNFGSTKDIYQDAHFGTDRWYCLGINGQVQSSIDGPAPTFTPDVTTNEAAGVDGMIDVPLGRGRLMARGEVNAIRQVVIGPATDQNGTVMMLGTGYLIMKEHLQPFVRWDRIQGDTPIGGSPRDITYAGANFYQKGHSLKLQGDLQFVSGTGQSVDGGRLQAQIDF